MQEWQPFVSFVVPLRNQKRENIQSLLGSLTAQDYLNFEIVLVGGKDDSTWEHIPEEFLEWGGLSLQQIWSDYLAPKSLSGNAHAVRAKYGNRLIIVEVELVKVRRRGKIVDWIGRDTNVKRNVGCRLARGDVLSLTDGKNTHERDYIQNALSEMVEHNVEALAGEMYALEEEHHGLLENILILYQEKGWVRRNPTFRQGYRLDSKSIRGVRTLPITASWWMTRNAYSVMGGFDERMTISYEDFASAIRYVQNGGAFWVTPNVFVYHRHRRTWAEMSKEWKRSGGGAADTLHFYRDSAFAQKRFRDVVSVLGSVLFALFVGLVLIVAQQWEIIGAGSFVVGLMGIGAGLANARSAGRWFGFFFPFLTVLLILIFSISFMRQYLLRDGAKRLLQTVWSLVMRTTS